LRLNSSRPFAALAKQARQAVRRSRTAYRQQGGTRSATLDEVAPRVGFQNARRYGEVAGFVFAGIPIAGCRVLDVGCGVGALTVWAALHGASHVVGLEPQLAGSTPGSSASLARVIDDFDLHDNVKLEHVPLDSYQGSGEFDLAILNAAVNHLNEAAVVRLHRDESAVAEYVTALQPLRELLRTGAFVIVADCARRSLWEAIGVQGPWTRGIEWEKHQQPHTWIDVFRRAGFEPYDVRWSPLRRTGWLTGNRIVQYFTMAHFVLRLRAV
jgi:SAM-dependent methyltransferase